MSDVERPDNARERTAAGHHVEVLISVVDGALADVTERVRQAGGRVLEDMPELCTLSVSLPEDTIDQIAEIDEVEAIERPRTYQLPPPDSPIQ